MGLKLLDLAKSYDVERQALLKLPGYYDLYKATLEIEQGVPLLKRLFGRDVSPHFAADLESMYLATGRSQGKVRSD